MGRIPQETVERVLRATDIVELIGGYLQLKRVGVNYRALCPFHSEKTPSFNVNPARQWFHCFGCGASGSAAQFVVLYENLDFPGAIRKLAERAGIRLTEETESPEEQQTRRLQDRLKRLHAEAAEWFHARLLEESEVSRRARDYLRQRRIARETVVRWKLGYAPDRSGPFLTWAREQGYADKVLVESGLLVASDDAPAGRSLYCRFRDRLMFPVWSDYGAIVAFSGRVLDKDARTAKYLNSPETPLFTKGRVLFGLYQSRRAILQTGRALVCEGQLDLIRCFESGIENVVAPLGTAFTADHARLLARLTKEAILCFDADRAGWEAAGRTFRELSTAGLFVRALQLPAGEDPDSLIEREGAGKFSARVESAPDFFDFQIAVENQRRDPASPRERRETAEALAESVALVPDGILRESVLVKVASRLGVPEPAFRKEVERFLRKSGSAAGKPGWESGMPPDPAGAWGHPQLAVLCRLALTHRAAKQWLGAAGETGFLHELDGGALVLEVAAAAFDPEDPASRSGYLAGLPPDEERLLAHLASDAPAGDSQAAAEQLLDELRRAHQRREVESRIARLREPGLPLAEVLRLQKEILDLGKGGQDSAPPFQVDAPF